MIGQSSDDRLAKGAVLTASTNGMKVNW